MPRMCCDCKFFDERGRRHRCPKCGGEMSFTALGPGALVAGGPEAVDISKWQRHVRRYEQIDISGKRRRTQIAAAIVFFSVVWRWGTALAGLSYGDVILQNLHIDPTTAVMYVGPLAIGIYVVAAMVAGGIAGASTVRWVPQGVGVALGLAILWGVLLALLHPYLFHRLYSDTLIFYFVAAAVTTALTTTGAYLGHLIIPPIRLPVA